jgi:glycosyltransferase involved in cell wall biosynthesis
MKTAHVLPWISRNAGGLFYSVSGLVKAEAALAGMQVEAFGSRDEFSDEDARQWLPSKVHTAAVVGPARLCYTPRLQRMVEEFDPDLIHSAAVWTWQAAMVNHIHARAKRPFVLSTRGNLDGWALRHSRWKKIIAVRLFQQKHFDQAACIHALNESELLSIRKFGLRNPVCVIPNGIELPNGNPQSRLPRSARNDMARNPQYEGRKVLLYLGRIHPKKGLINLVRAWADTRKRNAGSHRYRDWVLVIAGWDEGGHEKELRTLSMQCGVQDSIFFVGPKYGEEKAALYRSCDAFVLPSFSEGLPMVVLEAWAYGKPVLMTSACNLPEGFLAGAARRIEPKAESIAAGLGELFDAPESELGTMGRQGRALVADRFTWPSIAREMIAVYEWVLGGGAAPACVHRLGTV